MTVRSGEVEEPGGGATGDLDGETADVSHADSNRCQSEDIDPKWDEEQAEIITWPPDGRLLVDAGPGTGKTDVACARVAWLVNKGNVAPGKIWLISFTHAAVNELRNRIASHLNNPDDIFSITIATLDSHAWAIHSGFDHDARLSGSYDENITVTLEMIQEDEEIWEYLESLEHVIVDEAQDIVEKRADLVMGIFETVSRECGVTVFADDAQAIYDFSVDKSVPVGSDKRLNLSQRIQQGNLSPGFEMRSLSRVYRTGSPELLKIFSDTRKCVIKQSTAPDKRLQRVLEEIKSNAVQTKNISQGSSGMYGNDSFILYRKRAEVLLASAFFGTMPHRIRMPGLPRWIAPWLGACLSGFDSSMLSQADFMDLWDSNVEDRVVLAPEREVAWRELVHLAGETHSTVDMLRLRMKLGQKQPPRQFCFPEFGHRGPIIGTIHASKGRETGEVTLMLPPGVQGQFPVESARRANPDEETRVYFVGATRARDKLYVGESWNSLFPKELNSGRIIRCLSPPCDKVQMQIGSDGDIDSESVAGRDNYPDSWIPDNIQKTLLTLTGADEIAGLKVDLQDDDGKRNYLLNLSANSTPIGFMSRQFMNDIEYIAKKIYAKRGRKRFVGIPREIKYTRLFGVRTIVLPPDSPECERLFEPWSKSGIMLAPVILGFSTVYYQV